MPKAQKKDNHVSNSLFKVAENKIEENKILNYLLEKDPNNKLFKALLHSNKVILEDLMREAGYMLPQSKNTHEFLNKLKEAKIKQAEILLEKLKVNE